jgi:hypothetical protein
MEQQLRNGLEFLAMHIPSDADDWWIIGSAALVISGMEGLMPEDIDVVSTKRTLDKLLINAGAELALPKPHALFRSDPFRRIVREGALDIEVQGDLEVCRDGEWTPLVIVTREPIQIGKLQVYVPSLGEQAEIFRLFGRPKDVAKAVMIEAHQALP